MSAAGATGDEAHDVARDATAPARLEQLREEIEQLDQQLVDLLARRVSLARQVGHVKRAAGLPVLDPAREAAVVRRAVVLARNAHVDEEDARQIFWHVIGLSRRAQIAP